MTAKSISATGCCFSMPRGRSRWGSSRLRGDRERPLRSSLWVSLAGASLASPWPRRSRDLDRERSRLRGERDRALPDIPQLLTLMKRHTTPFFIGPHLSVPLHRRTSPHQPAHSRHSRLNRSTTLPRSSPRPSPMHAAARISHSRGGGGQQQREAPPSSHPCHTLPKRAHNRTAFPY